MPKSNTAPKITCYTDMLDSYLHILSEVVKLSGREYLEMVKQFVNLQHT